MRRIGYQNAVLTAIAVLLALGLIDRRSGGGITELASAQAQPSEPEGGGMTNKLERMDAKLSAGLSVKVTSMPAIQVNDTGKKNKDKDKDEAPSVKPASPK